MFYEKVKGHQADPSAGGGGEQGRILHQVPIS